MSFLPPVEHNGAGVVHAWLRLPPLFSMLPDGPNPFLPDHPPRIPPPPPVFTKKSRVSLKLAEAKNDPWTPLNLTCVSFFVSIEVKRHFSDCEFGNFVDAETQHEWHRNSLMAMLIPAVLIIIFQFFNARRKYRGSGFCSGRPGIAV